MLIELSVRILCTGSDVTFRLRVPTPVNHLWYSVEMRLRSVING